MNDSEIKPQQSRVPSVDELVKQLKQRHPNPNRYVGGFYLSKKPLLEKYEELIQKEAVKWHEELKKQDQSNLDSKEAESNDLKNIIQQIHKFGSDIDYLSLDSNDRKRFSELSSDISKKPLDKWSAEEKIIYRFWYKIPKYGFRQELIQDSGVATALKVIATLELIGAPIAGLGVGSDNALVGWMVFVSGIISGLIFLGFARVIQNTFESSQRLRRLEMLIERGYDNTNAG